MGNHPSTGSSRNSHPNNPFRRPTGSLGLTRAELDERCKPSGLYESCSWDDRTIRKLIGDGKLAARQKGKDDRTTGTEQECPICFFHYDEINMLKCCKATICTECYLQVQSPNALSWGGIGIGSFGGGSGGGNSAGSGDSGNISPCPFCNKPQMSIVVAKRLDDHDVKKREEEEQKIIEATIRARSNSETVVTGATSGETSCSSNSGIAPGGFGSRLHQEMMRTRSRTLSADFTSRPSSSSSSSTANDNASDSNDAHTMNTIKNVAVTPEERRALEDQMRSQLSHPLMVEMQRNAELESQRHLLQHAERRRDRIRHSRAELGRLIDRAREREHGLDLFAGTFDRSYGDEEDDDDDIGGGRGTGSSYGDNLLARLDGERGSRPPTMNDLYLLEAALYLSAREDSRRRRRNRNRGRRNDNSLLRTLLSGGGGSERGLGGGALHRGDDTTSADGGDSGSNDRRNREENEEDASRNDQHSFSAADILFAGLSEANQLEMAIQMSIRDEEERQERERQRQQQQEDNEEAGTNRNVEQVDNENEENQEDNQEAGDDDSNVVEQQEEENIIQEENAQEVAGVEGSEQEVEETREENAAEDTEATENLENSQVTSVGVDESAAETAETNAAASDTGSSAPTPQQLEAGDNMTATTNEGAEPGV